MADTKTGGTRGSMVESANNIGNVSKTDSPEETTVALTFFMLCFFFY